MPECSVAQEVTGKSAQDIFSTGLFILEIKNAAHRLQIDVDSLQEKSLPLYLEGCLASSIPGIRDAANDIMRFFGERLAVILLCLKEGTEENRRARPDWSAEHWDYWHSLEQIILVGGLASTPLGERLKYYVEQVFDRSGKHPYRMILGTDSSSAGLRGCATYLEDVSDSQVNLIFDYGQSFIKRSYAVMENQRLKDIVILDKTLSLHAEWDITDPVIEKREAQELNRHFLWTITHTISEVEEKGLLVHPQIVLSIANYVKEGVIANRGGYGKLRLIAPNYAAYLSEHLRELTGRDFHFTLVHDGTAMAAGYSGCSNSVCLSLGTAFGVGFPPAKHEN